MDNDKSTTEFNSCWVINPNLNEINAWVFNSYKEPRAILRKRLNSSLDRLPNPSAMLLGIETADRFICEVKPNNSDLGNKEVIAYIFSTRQTDFCQTIKSS